MRFLAFVIPMLCATPALAQFYAGAEAGISSYKNGCTDAGSLGFSSCDARDRAWKLLGGYEINRNFAAEFAYVDLGELKASTPAGIDTRLMAYAWELSVIGAIPINALSLYARLGGYYGRTDLAGASTGYATGSNITYGLGIQYYFTRNLGARAEWQRYSQVSARSDQTGVQGASDIGTATLGVLWRFE